jgi:S1-C subfamily serine protease
MKNLLLMTTFFVLSFSSFGQTNSDMLEGILPSVVTVGVYKTQVLKQILGSRGDASVSEVAYRKALNMAGVQTSGSGFILQKKGKLYVITNAHVIENASTETGSIKIFTFDRQQYEATLIGGDNFYDIAVLEIKQTPINTKSVQFRNTETRIGEPVFAVGNPLGRHPYSVMNGIISAKNRIVSNRPGYLQSSATLSGGNSGGPLFDTKGNVVGINTATGVDQNTRLAQSQINYALNAQTADRIVNDILENNGRVIRAFIGVELIQRSQSIKQEKISLSGELEEESSIVMMDKKPVIYSVVEDSPATKILSDYIGFTLEKINNESIESISEALIEFEKMSPNTNVSLTLSSEGVTKTVSIKTGLLDTKALENISIKAIKSRLDKIEINRNEEYPAFSIRSKGVYSFNKLGKFQPQNTYSSTDTYYMMAGGYVASETDKELYSIKTFADVGAALRISSLVGVFDIVVVKKGTEKPELLHLNLSGKEDIFQQTLWN